MLFSVRFAVKAAFDSEYHKMDLGEKLKFLCCCVECVQGWVCECARARVSNVSERERKTSPQMSDWDFWRRAFKTPQKIITVAKGALPAVRPVPLPIGLVPPRNGPTRAGESVRSPEYCTERGPCPRRRPAEALSLRGGPSCCCCWRTHRGPPARPWPGRESEVWSTTRTLDFVRSLAEISASELEGKRAHSPRAAAVTSWRFR